MTKDEIVKQLQAIDMYVSADRFKNNVLLFESSFMLLKDKKQFELLNGIKNHERLMKLRAIQ